MKYIYLALLFITATAHSAESPKNIADATQKAHHMDSWRSKEIVRADINILFGDKAIVDGVFTFEAQGGRARYDRKDGASIIFDGKTAWVTPAAAAAPKGRFHVLTWPWFVMAPFKMQGAGITLVDSGLRKADGTSYQTLYQTFSAGAGDTPDDWYRFFIDKNTRLVDAMSYIVTYGKDAATANKQPSMIKYFDYTTTTTGEPRVAQRYELWLWDPESSKTTGGTPKGTGTVKNITYLKSSDKFFDVPVDAKELKLPE